MNFVSYLQPYFSITSSSSEALNISIIIKTLLLLHDQSLKPFSQKILEVLKFLLTVSEVSLGKTFSIS